MPAYRCATCGREVTYAGPMPPRYPFCSPRCQLVDLGRWLHEDYTIDRDVMPEDLPGTPRRDEEREEHRRGDG